MIAAGKGERDRNRSEYPVRKQGHGQLLAKWLTPHLANSFSTDI